jgi:UDP-N-acetylmuramyl tripeptide synthase
MQLVNSLYNGARVFVDYAHTPDALKSVLVSNYFNFKKPNLVFGCGGNRDKTKRIKMGKIAYQYANKIYLTDDNPRNENPYDIRKKIHFHCSKAFNIGDRRLAIKTAIENLQFKEILIIAGKGHEKKQIIKNKIINFDDVKVANYYIKKRNLKNP